MPERIYLSAPHMGTREEHYVSEAFRSNWLSSVGPNLDAFEASLNERVGGHSVALSSGTAAVHLGLKLLSVEAGDEVFCSTLTFSGSCNPIVYEKAHPVFLDSDASYNLDPNVLHDAFRDAKKRGKLPRALVMVHLYGQPADLESILAIAREYDVPVLEDAAEALGTLYWGSGDPNTGKQVGAFCDVGVLSFNGNKIITTTAGGALIAKDQKAAEKVRYWSTQARDPGLSYEHSELGYNYRMSNVLAGIGRGQLEVLEERVLARRAVAEQYREALADIAELSLMPEVSYGRHTRWLTVFSLRPNPRVTRDGLIHALAAENIESRPVWKPMHMQKFYGGARNYGGDVARSLYENGICFPSSSFLTANDIARVVAAIRRVFQAAPR